VRYLQFDEALSKCHSAVIADVLDRLDRRAQCMQPHVRPLLSSMRVWGEAVTARFDAVESVPDRPFELEMALTDTLREGQVIVTQCNTKRLSAAWGGLLTAAARSRGARGVVTDGGVRDYAEITEQGFATFCAGLTPYDSLGRMDVVAIDVPIVCGGIAVEPGDLIFGDADGIVVVPAAISERVIAMALDKIAGEARVRERLRAGESVAGIYRQYGVL
jgi:4-hydroxy-4-methyl-2-oxoglutarate aldolase